MKEKKDLVEVANWLNNQPPDQRVDAISMIRALSEFCWQCGQNFHDARRVCHCENDE